MKTPQNKTTYTTPNMKNIHSRVYSNINIMTVPKSILVKQVDLLKHDILNI